MNVLFVVMLFKPNGQPLSLHVGMPFTRPVYANTWRPNGFPPNILPMHDVLYVGARWVIQNLCSDIVPVILGTKRQMRRRLIHSTNSKTFGLLSNSNCPISVVMGMTITWGWMDSALSVANTAKKESCCMVSEINTNIKIQIQIQSVAGEKFVSEKFEKE